MRKLDLIPQEYRNIVYGVLFGALLIAWIFVVGVTIERLELYDTDTVIPVLTLVVVFFGVFIAGWKLRKDQIWRRSEIYLEQSKEFLEKSYSALIIDKETHYPRNDRQLWLTSARFLLAAEALGDKIIEQSHRETLDEYFAYWRYRFWELLQFEEKGKTPPESYFYKGDKPLSWVPGERAPISEKSVAVIHRFMKWPKDLPDRRL